MRDRHGMEQMRVLQDDRRNVERMKHEAHGDDRLVRQDETRCRVLGVDAEGVTHVHDTERDRIVAVSEAGIEVQVDLTTCDGKSAATWMVYVDEKRGWAHEQWRGYKLANAVFGGDST